MNILRSTQNLKKSFTYIWRYSVASNLSGRFFFLLCASQKVQTLHTKKRLMKWWHNNLTKIFWQIPSPFYFLDFNRPSSSLAGHYQYMGNDNAPDYANLTSISRRGAGYYNTQCGTISFISDFFSPQTCLLLKNCTWCSNF